MSESDPRRLFVARASCRIGEQMDWDSGEVSGLDYISTVCLGGKYRRNFLFWLPRAGRADAIRT
jgi:hypothetical protein